MLSGCSVDWVLFNKFSFQFGAFMDRVDSMLAIVCVGKTVSVEIFDGDTMVDVGKISWIDTDDCGSGGHLFILLLKDNKNGRHPLIAYVTTIDGSSIVETCKSVIVTVTVGAWNPKYSPQLKGVVLILESVFQFSIILSSTKSVGLLKNIYEFT